MTFDLTPPKPFHRALHAAVVLGVVGAPAAAAVLAPPALPGLASLAAHRRAYTIHDRLEIVGPLDLAGMQSDVQTARIVARHDATVEVEVTVHPYRALPVGQDAQWQRTVRETPGLAAYLAPAPAANWDEAFRMQLLADLARDGIDPNGLTDRQLVQRVSTWLVRNRSKTELPFVTFAVNFVDGRPVPDALQASHVLRLLLAAHLPGSEQGLATCTTAQGAYAASAGTSCTIYAIMQTAVLRALGIPTRIVLDIPPVDANDPAQRAMAERLVDPVARAKVLAGIEVGATGKTFMSHTINEVYVGHRWVRLNYNQLGQRPLDRYYLGLLVQVGTYRDWSDVALAAPWGRRGDSRHRVPTLLSVNPYRSLSLGDGWEGSGSSYGGGGQLRSLPIQRAAQ